MECKIFELKKEIKWNYGRLHKLPNLKTATL